MKPTSQMNVLVVDDQTSLRHRARASIAPLNFASIDEAENGAVAIRCLAAGTYDLIVTDINMPILDGIKLVNFVRSSPHYRAVKIVVVSTDVQKANLIRAMDQGADAYVEKPYETTYLCEVVRSLCS